MPTAADRAISHGAAGTDGQRGENLVDQDRQVPFSHVALHLVCRTAGRSARRRINGPGTVRCPGRRGARRAPPARPRSATDTAATASVPRSRAGSTRRPRPPRSGSGRRTRAGSSGRGRRPWRSSSTSTAPELMKRPNCRAAAFVVGRPWILAARSSQVSAGKIARQPSSQRASVAPWASRRRKRTGTATRPRSSSACRNSPVRNDARSIVPVVHHYSPHGPIWNHRAPLYRASTTRQGVFGHAGGPSGPMATDRRSGSSGSGRRHGAPLELSHAGGWRPESGSGRRLGEHGQLASASR